MEIDPLYFESQKQKAHALYTAKRELYCPYFKLPVILNADGFHHLQFSSRRERNKNEQLLKFRLLPLALDAIRQSGTLQEYRKMLSPIGKRSATDGAISMKEVEYWAFIAILGDKQTKIRTIVRKVGNGNHIFWSAMLHSKRTNGKQRLFTEGIEDEE